MKKGIVLLVSAVTLGLVACGGGSEKATTEATTVAPTTSTEAPTEATTEAPTAAAPTEAVTEADKSIPLSHTNSDGSVLTFTKYELIKDYEGKPAVALYFDYTNNGSEAKSAIFDYGITVFQDGIQCSAAVITNGPEEINNSMKEIKTGITIPVCFSYALGNTASNLELEVGDLIDFSGNKATQIIQISDGTVESNVQETETQAQAETQAVADGVINYVDSDGSTVVYAKHEIIKDYQGNPALAVYFNYTNNSDTSKSAMTTYLAKAFQNGVECSIGMSTSAPDEYQNSLKEIKKGATLPVCWLFSLSDESDVEIEVGPIFGGEAAKQTISLK